MDAAARGVRRLLLWTSRVLSGETAPRATRGRVRYWPRGCYWQTVRSGGRGGGGGAGEAVRQDVDEKAADELVRAERHDFVSRAAIGAIILVPEGDAVVVGGDKPAVGAGDAVGIAREISEHRLGSTERRLCVEGPLDLAQRRQIRLELGRHRGGRGRQKT